MRILQIVSLLSPDGAFGGPARVALNQCVELASRGHDVTLAAGVRGYRDPPGGVDGVKLQVFKARSVLPRYGFLGMTVPGLIRWVSNHGTNFDIVHLHFGRDLMVLPVAAMVRRRRVPYVLQTHGMVIPSAHPLAGPLDAMWTRRLLRGAKSVLYLTELERKQLSEVARADICLAQLINGVPYYSPIHTPRRDIEILFVGRLDARKRPELFVKMARRLLSLGLDARFTLVGPDEGEGAAVRAAIQGEERIRWEGPLDPAEIPRRMAAASVYVLPSDREPYPMSVLEALSVGLPVVICDDCGLAPVIARTESGVVASGTVTSLADAVIEVLNDPQRFGLRARETALREFGMKAIGDRLMSVYR